MSTQEKNFLAPPTQTTSTGSGKDLPNLDMLRAVAVCCVLYSHIAAALRMPVNGQWWGAFGVAIFFVHTSLVLMWSLERRPNTLDFYVRRIARIYPLAMVVVLIAVLTHAPVGVYAETGSFFNYYAPSWKQVLTHMLLVQNLFSGNFIVYPMWSLPFEVQMYALLPALYFFMRKNMALWPLLLFWLLAAAFAHQAFETRQLNLAVAIPYFVPGLMAYIGFSRRKAVLPGWSFAIALAVIIWVGGHAGNWQRAWWPCLALGLALPSFRQLRPSWWTKVCWQVARYSYGIYLMHPFAIVLGFYVCRGRSWPVQFAVMFASLAVFSLAAFHLIESPLMKLGAKAAVVAARRFKMPIRTDLDAQNP